MPIPVPITAADSTICQADFHINRRISADGFDTKVLESSSLLTGKLLVRIFAQINDIVIIIINLVIEDLLTYSRHVTTIKINPNNSEMNPPLLPVWKIARKKTNKANPNIIDHLVCDRPSKTKNQQRQ